jgi:NAD(P)-dependent dehydrogenase (short-subunit alcohol dehydrogenase family)
MRLQEQTVFVTGAGSGIGQATAVRAAEEGATVVVTDVDEDGGHETVDRIVDEGGDAEFHELDVRDAAAFEDAVTAAAAAHDGLDVLVNNAGIELFKPFEATSTEELRERIDVNFMGVWNGCKAALPVMKEAGGGAIVNMSSVSGQLGIQMQSAYGVTKAGIANLTKSVASEAGPHGIRVNALAPGAVETPMVEEQVIGKSDHPDAVREQFADVSVFDRYGQPEEIADCAVFLASDEASFVTGEVLRVDGGFSLF